MAGGVALRWGKFAFYYTYIKQMNVVHTDLKPENIMFSRPSVEARKAVAKYIDASADVGNITEV